MYIKYARVHGTKSYVWNSKNGGYDDDDSTMFKNNVHGIKQV